MGRGSPRASNRAGHRGVEGVVSATANLTPVMRTFQWSGGRDNVFPRPLWGTIMMLSGGLAAHQGWLGGVCRMWGAALVGTQGS